MAATKAYVVTNAAGDRPDIAGQVRAVGSTIYLTDAEAAFELTRGTIVLNGTVTPPPVTPTTPDSVVSSDAPAAYVFPIVPDANTDLVRPTRGIRCETGGSLFVNTVGGDQNVELRFADRETRPVRVTRVLSVTGGASGIEGMA